jgi:hypothetical protein
MGRAAALFPRLKNAPLISAAHVPVKRPLIDRAPIGMDPIRTEPGKAPYCRRPG